MKPGPVDMRQGGGGQDGSLCLHVRGQCPVTEETSPGVRESFYHRPPDPLMSSLPLPWALGYQGGLWKGEVLQAQGPGGAGGAAREAGVQAAR